jgi:hypothetical protein
MEYNTQNYWVSGLCPSRGILNNFNAVFRKLDPFSSSGEGREAPTLMGPLDRANLNHWAQSQNTGDSFVLFEVFVLNVKSKSKAIPVVGRIGL